MPVPSPASPAYDLKSVRAQFKVTGQGLAYLNHAGMSPLPAPVKAAMLDVTEQMAARGSLMFGELFEPLLQQLGERIGALANAEPGEIAYVQNTSTALNLIAQSLPLQPGDGVILCDVEFPANVYPWLNLERNGIDVRIIPAQEGGLTVEALDAHFDERTRVVAVSAVQFFTGRREDLVALGEYCARRGAWLIVDAIQAAGIVPLDMRAMNIAALAAGSQKALCGPPGQGFMAIRSDVREVMQPIFVGGASVEGWEHWLDYDMTLQPGAACFGLGTPNLVGLAGLSAAAGFLLELGVENIAQWVSHLSCVAIEDLTARGYEVITPADENRHANIVTFALPGDPLAAVGALAAEGVILREHLDARGNPYLRLSSHCYNTEADILRVGSILEDHFHGQ